MQRLVARTVFPLQGVRANHAMTAGTTALRAGAEKVRKKPFVHARATNKSSVAATGPTWLPSWPSCDLCPPCLQLGIWGLPAPSGVLIDAAGTLIVPAEPVADVYLRFGARMGMGKGRQCLVGSGGPRYLAQGSGECPAGGLERVACAKLRLFSD